MIFIPARFHVRPEDADRWPEITADFTAATGAEPGCPWFDWSRRVDDPTVDVLIEAFRDVTPAPRTWAPPTSRPPSSPCRPVWCRPPRP